LPPRSLLPWLLAGRPPGQIRSPARLAASPHELFSLIPPTLSADHEPAVKPRMPAPGATSDAGLPCRRAVALHV